VSSIAPVAIPIGDHLVRDAVIEQFFIQALASWPGGFVSIERWEDFVRQPDNSLEKEWMWKVTVGGRMHGYQPNEFILDLAVPIRPGTSALQDADLLERRGRVARLLGVGVTAAPVQEQPAAAVVAAVEEAQVTESKVIHLPAAPPQEFAPEDPNSFPG
jgi:hypothetical protein